MQVEYALSIKHGIAFMGQRWGHTKPNQPMSWNKVQTGSHTEGWTIKTISL